MEHFGRCHSVDSADRDKSSCSGSISVLSKDQITQFPWINISLERSTGELRYLTPLWVSRNEEPRVELYRAENNIPHHQKLKEQIRAALKLLTFHEKRVLVQFWSPLDVGKHQQLTSIDQPFGLSVIDEGLYLYRRDSERNVFLEDKDHAEEHISPPARVFTRGLPEWTSDLNNYKPKDFPQQECAIRCNLHGYLALPVFDSTTNLCVGVIELLMSSITTDYASDVQQVHEALEKQSLACVCRASYVFDELEKIFQILVSVCDYHNLPLAQTWAVSPPSSSFVSHDKSFKKSCSSFSTKCIGKVCMSADALPFYVRNLQLWKFQNECKNRHMDKSQGVVGRAMSFQGVYFCRDVTELNQVEYPLVWGDKILSCFAVCLHSVEGNDDYVLEFFLPLGTNDGRFVQDVVKTLKQKIEVATEFILR